MRCKNCKYAKKSEVVLGIPDYECLKTNITCLDADDFCSYGERKDEECPKCVYEYDGETMEYCAQGACPNFKTVEQIKAEAYKEFAERIRECCTSNDDLSADVWLSITTDINCILKEMVGEEE